jgi:cytochrome b561
MEAHEDPRSNAEGYTPIYAALHWTIALCVVSLFAMQYVRDFFGDDAHAFVREMHKSIGLVLIVLIAWRLILRLRSAAPRPFPDSSARRAAIAAWVHKGLWLLMVTVPLLGVAFLLARGRGVNFFGLLAIGPLTTETPPWGDLTLVFHRRAAFILIALVIVHAGAALFHRFALRDGVMSRMSVRRKERLVVAARAGSRHR